MDSLNLKKQNQSIIQWHWRNLSELLSLVKRNNKIISIEDNSGTTLTGEFANFTKDILYIREWNHNYELNLTLTPIPLTKINVISINSAEQRLFDEWLKINIKPKNVNLAEIYFNYADSNRNASFFVGQILSENSHYIKFLALNDLGQVDNLCLINKNYIQEIISRDSMLDYYQFLTNYHRKHQSFNIRNLNINTSATTFSEVVKKNNSLISINKADEITAQFGKIKQINTNYFNFQELVDYQFLEQVQKVSFDDLVSVEISSNLQILLTQYFK